MIFQCGGSWPLSQGSRARSTQSDQGHLTGTHGTCAFWNICILDIVRECEYVYINIETSILWRNILWEYECIWILMKYIVYL